MYLGSFTVPRDIHAGGQANAGFEYGGYALGINPIKNSLYMTGHDWDQFYGEISIPALGQRAALLQPLVDPTVGKIYQINPGVGHPVLGGSLVVNNTLVLSAFTFYDGESSAKADHFQRPLTLSGPGSQVIGPYRVNASMNPGYTGGYMAPIPAAWQAPLGGTALTGNCCLSVIARTSRGPALFAFDPVSQDATAVPLVYYDNDDTHALAPVRTQNPMFNLATRIRGVVMIDGSVLFVGVQGTGPYCYGEGAECKDPVNPYKGEHAYPYRTQIWAYAAADLAKVKAGTLAPWQVKPYATWTLPQIGTGYDVAGGMVFHPTTKRVYITKRFGEGDRPTVEVYEVRP